ncbi:MAG: glucosidase [Vicinamibacterales bacterium]
MSAHESERTRLEADEQRMRNWKKWGPYLAERQWGTVREDYSEGGTCWSYLPHDHARSRAYRWGEDGLLGLTDRECRLCFSLALWNGQDSILKERLFGLDNEEGNHGEDVKELYYYLDATPTYSYLKALYKYPLVAYPYAQMLTESRRRGHGSPEFEIDDAGVFDEGRYADVFLEYAKADAEDILIRVTCVNRGAAAATLHVLPTVWLRNTWSWGRQGEGYWPMGNISLDAAGELVCDHPSLGRYRFSCDAIDETKPEFLFTDNETNVSRLFGIQTPHMAFKDAFHDVVVHGRGEVVAGRTQGTKAAAWYRLTIPGGGTVTLRFRLTASPANEPADEPFGPAFERTFEQRRWEADEFHLASRNAPLTDDERRIVRQADAGLLWSHQFYHYIVDHWLQGDPAKPTPPVERKSGRNARWPHVYARDVLSMPDKWEYPWFAAWDLAFHCVALSRIDAASAKRQLVHLCREWYMHPNGQLPAYEFAFGDVNPPVHAWAALRVYQLSASQEDSADRLFLESVFQKCLVNFTWWVNRHDEEDDNLFSGGFLGLDNISMFDRSKPLPGGGRLEQADATAWMAFYCTTMLSIALELAKHDAAYVDIASKFLEHFVSIAQAMNALGGTGLWNDEDGFYYDLLSVDGSAMSLRARSIVGIIPLFAAETLDANLLERLPHFRSRLNWILANKPGLSENSAFLPADPSKTRRLLAVPTRDRLERVLARLLDEGEFLSPHGVRSLSKAHADQPWVLTVGDSRLETRYAPGESDSGVFGGNSNWRGPVWFPVNYLLIDALKRYHRFYLDDLRVECPTGSGVRLNLLQVAEEIEGRLASLFLRGADGSRPCLGRRDWRDNDPQSRDLLLFHEYFHGDNGRGLGASHQTGWTALIANVLERVAFSRAARDS